MKKHKVLTVVIILCFSLLLSGCKYNTSSVNIKDIFVVEAKVDFAEGYYLSKDGVLYSPGADGDVSAYVCYRNKIKGIVAKNVRSFSTIYNGGYYVTNDNKLYFWNWESIDYLRYRRNKQKLIMNNVSSAYVSLEFTVYKDVFDKLYLIGDYDGETYSIEKPKLLAYDVCDFSITGDGVLYIKNNGEIECYGEKAKDAFFCDYIKKCKFSKTDSPFKILCYPDLLLILENGRLHFYGKNGELAGNDSDEYESCILAENIKTFSSSFETIVAVDFSGNAYLWGEVLSNGPENTEEPEYTYLNGKRLFSNINNVFLHGPAAICFVTKDGKTEYYGSTGSVCSAGNSNRGSFIGINNKPIVWQ